ncbi:MAG TPA: SRPBCC family protein [Chitinophagaceae bacterium]|nr:SRPBCC family protein [Chitinophagaceae bacterium]
MDKGLTARAFTTINVPNAKVWEALTDPEIIRQYRYGAETVSNWKEGSDIVWKGEWEGMKYEDKGVILAIEPGYTLRYSHFSTLAGVPDVLENYHTVTYTLSNEDDYSFSKEEEETFISLTQDNNADEKALENSQKMWETLLTDLKKILEK